MSEIETTTPQPADEAAAEEIKTPRRSRKSATADTATNALAIVVNETNPDATTAQVAELKEAGFAVIVMNVEPQAPGKERTKFDGAKETIDARSRGLIRNWNAALDIAHRDESWDYLTIIVPDASTQGVIPADDLRRLVAILDADKSVGVAAVSPAASVFPNYITDTTIEAPFAPYVAPVFRRAALKLMAGRGKLMPVNFGAEIIHSFRLRQAGFKVVITGEGRETPGVVITPEGRMMRDTRNGIASALRTYAGHTWKTRILAGFDGMTWPKWLV